MTGAAKIILAARLLAAALLLSASAVAAAPPPAQLTANSLVPEATPVPEKARLDCLAKGGKIRAVCRSARLKCVVAYPDAGKACTDNSQCASNKCVADPAVGPIGAPVAGKCKVTNDPCGCTTMVKDGKRGPTLCVD
jgi:hypothetical protein